MACRIVGYPVPVALLTRCGGRTGMLFVIALYGAGGRFPETGRGIERRHLVAGAAGYVILRRRLSHPAIEESNPERDNSCCHSKAAETASEVAVHFHSFFYTCRVIHFKKRPGSEPLMMTRSIFCKFCTKQALSAPPSDTEGKNSLLPQVYI